MTGLSWLLAWSAQVALLAAAGALAASLLANGKPRLIFWQCLLAAFVLLPVIEPWRSSTVVVLSSAPVQAAVAASQPVHHAAPLWRSGEWLWLIPAGAILRLLWIGLGFLRLRRYRRTAIPLAESPLPFASAARWFVSASVPGPVAYGWRTILLPARVMQLPARMREAIACHELVHIRRCDWLFVLGEEMIRAALWFHPAVWFALSRIQLAREYAVDCEAVRLTNDRDVYLDALVEVAALGLHPDLAPAPLFLRKRHLHLRVAAILKEVSMSKSRIAAGIAAASFAMLFAAGIALWVAPFVASAQTVADDVGVTVDAGGPLLHRAAVRNPGTTNGALTIEATLNSKGEVSDAQVLSGPEELRHDALASVLQWHYSPGLTRVQISMRFEATGRPEAGVGAGVGRGVGGGVGAGIGAGFGTGTGRGRGRGGAAVPPLPAVNGPSTLKKIEFFGFTPQAEQELRRRLPVKEGDQVLPGDPDRVVEAIREFDEHSLIGVRRDPVTGDTTLDISLPNAGSRFTASSAGTTVPDVPTIGRDVQAQNRINSVVPVYPPLAKAARVQGVVLLHIVIAKDGTVGQMELVSGNPLLVQAAKDAVAQWTYKPTLLNGQPTEVQTDVTINFSLQ